MVGGIASAFFIGVYQDQSEARENILILKALYPESPILSIADGVENSSYQTFCSDLKVIYQQGLRLKLMNKGGLWTERFLKLYLEQTNSDYLIKIDPDTGIHRSLRYLPECDLFGSVINDQDRSHIQGGAIGFSRSAARKIVNSGLLGSQEYCTHRYAYPRYQPPYLKTGEDSSSQWLSVEDLIVFDVALKLGLKIQDYAEVSCHWRTPALGDFAFVHPNRT